MCDTEIAHQKVFIRLNISMTFILIAFLLVYFSIESSISNAIAFVLRFVRQSSITANDYDWMLQRRHQNSLFIIINMEKKNISCIKRMTVIVERTKENNVWNVN